jgi:Cellulose binding domain
VRRTLTLLADAAPCDAGRQVIQAWSATVTQSRASVTATNLSWNGAPAPGASTTFGFLGSWTGSNPVPTVSCT